MFAINIVPGTGSGVFGLFMESGWVGKGIVIILLGFSVASWAVILIKYQYLRRAERESRDFMATFRKTRAVAELQKLAEVKKYSPLATLFLEGYREADTIVKSFPDGRVTGEDRPSFAQEIDRALKVTTQDEIVYLEQYLALLGTVGTVAPLLGLFGTIWGIMDSFYGIGLKGAGDIGALAPGLAGALVTTIAGLFVAIPTVVAYNYFAEKIRDMASRMDSFSLEFQSFIERMLLRRAS
jgi:biopolymer transport protein TolQ